MSKYALVERATGRVVQEGEEIVNNRGDMAPFIKVEAKPTKGGEIWVKPQTIWARDFDGRWFMSGFPNYQIVEVPDE